MKNVLLFTTVILFALTSVSAQVKLGFGLGYASPTGDAKDFLDGGISGHAELGYGVTEDLDVSLLYQGDFLVGAELDGAGVGNLTLSSFMANTRYFFTKSGFRPYGSLGFGLTNVGAVELEGSGLSIEVLESTSNFSFRPALGFKYGVLNVNAAYLSAGKIGEGAAEQSIGDFTFNIGLLFTIGGA
ncbi:hypothetical protein [Spongiimicrobium sp. 3-5]|uniref:hypothetical protein n=1 Tax=Spongiimicrobium sp. 3-5 TaxID=3332596 RepID=UPI00397E9C0D